jgi:hypothetical protein
MVIEKRVEDVSSETSRISKYKDNAADNSVTIRMRLALSIALFPSLNSRTQVICLEDVRSSAMPGTNT